MRYTKMRRAMSRYGTTGFTLVELLIVISIIAVLASLVITGLSAATAQKNLTEASTMVETLKNGLKNYQSDEPSLPAFGRKPDPEKNHFPELWAALMNEPKHGGGSGSPYIEVPKDKIAVYDGEVEGEKVYRRATRDEIDDPEVEKYVLDPWGNPYVYRCNKGLDKEDWMLNYRGVDIYSWGPNGKDDTILRTEGDENDDVH